MARVTVYTTPACPFCYEAKRLLASLGIPFHEIDVAAADDRRAEMVTRAGGRCTVPQIFIDDEHVGGYTELSALAGRGGLAHLP